MVSRVKVVAAAMTDGATDPLTKGSAALGVGSYPEVTLQSNEVRFLGRVDLMTLSSEETEIVDYKTGAPQSHHQDQLRVYALLWSLDAARNPAHRLATRLVIAYADGDELVSAPTVGELEDLASNLRGRIASADAALTERPPAARPSTEWCPTCAVRQLCEDYWTSEVSVSAALTEGDRFDLDAAVLERNGSRSWIVASVNDNRRVLVRTLTESVEFSVGESIRVLNLVLVEDEETDQVIGSMTTASEVFRVDPAVT